MPAPYPSSFLLRGGLPDGDHPYYYQDKEPLLQVNTRGGFLVCAVHKSYWLSL